MPHCSERSTLGRSFKALGLLVLAVQLAPGADLKAAVSALERGDARQALSYLLAARSTSSPLGDYIAYWTAQAHMQAKSYADVAAALDPVWHSKVTSPLAGRAALLGARAMIEAGDGAGAIRLLKHVPPEQLPQPQALLVEARARRLSGEERIAAERLQAVYYTYPKSDEAAQAAQELEHLSDVPPVPGTLRLDRARKLNENGGAAKALAEFEHMIPLLDGEEREMARVGVGAALYQQRQTDAAIRQLQELEPRGTEARAERLYWLVACHSRQNDHAAMLAALEELSRLAPASSWRLKALVLAGNRLLVDNDAAHFTPLYTACAEAFPQSEQAAYCHWKVVWRSYLERRPNAAAQLAEHLRRYPASEKAGAAVYYLGRVAEDSRDPAAARRFYHELETRFPNYYYAHLARTRLARAELHGSAGSPATEKLLKSIEWPERDRRPDFSPDPATNLRLARARLLTQAGLDTWAEIELRFAARQRGANRYLLAQELAEMAARRKNVDVSVRCILGVAPDYLWVARDAAPRRFWQLAFPFPYRAQVDRLARQNKLDPFLVAALIRQESLFNPNAVSVSNAIGLMQVMPGTGRELGRALGLRNVGVANLKQPEVNLKLGIYYLSRNLEARDGNVEETLAGYNAGPNRIPVWRTWAEFREPAEFVETIPFTQTRDYVQIILRNAEFYRWLYAGTVVPTEPEAKPKPEPKPKPKAAKSVKPAAKRKAAIKAKKTSSTAHREAGSKAKASRKRQAKGTRSSV
jgi:soluble lytic murein transglycosylase